VGADRLGGERWIRGGTQIKRADGNGVAYRNGADGLRAVHAQAAGRGAYLLVAGDTEEGWQRSGVDAEVGARGNGHCRSDAAES